ncbi:cyclin-like protein [Xylaria sp. CBS 124048]|nr:cyclin-like protein [Xylaria sp. CBS 124048]
MPVTDTLMDDVSDNDVAGVSGSASGTGYTSGPSIGVIKCGRPYLHESTIRRKLAEMNSDVLKDAATRLQGVQLIDDVRNALQLPIITYIAACGYYHRFRLEIDPKEYQWSDAALACLFVACKSEDTHKKSRDILCANHNLKNPDRTTTPDDKLFDSGSKMLIGLERHVIETLRFDFQVRNPVKILAKIVKAVLGSGPEASDFFTEAFKVVTDMYKTFAPLKHTSFTCAFTVARLTALVTGLSADAIADLEPKKFYTCEEWVAEVMLDVLDLYTDHCRSTLFGQTIKPEIFINTKIMVINHQLERPEIPRYQNFCAECEVEGFPSPFSAESPTFMSPTGTNSSTGRATKKAGGTFRFLFDPDEVHQERATYNEYTKDEWEEWTEEVEEMIPEREKRPRSDLGPEPRAPPREPRGARGHRGHGRGRGRGHGGRGGHDPAWHRGGRHEHRGRGRGGGGGGGSIGLYY